MRMSDWSSDVCSSDLLAVLQAELHDTPGRAVAEAQLRTMTRLIEHHLGRAAATAGSGRALGSRCAVRPVAEEIAAVLDRIHASRNIEAEIAIPADAIFHGPREELQEMLANLMENAWQWARGKLRVGARTAEHRLILTDEDDVPRPHTTARPQRRKEAVT